MSEYLYNSVCTSVWWPLVQCTILLQNICVYNGLRSLLLQWPKNSKAQIGEEVQFSILISLYLEIVITLINFQFCSNAPQYFYTWAKKEGITQKSLCLKTSQSVWINLYLISPFSLSFFLLSKTWQKCFCIIGRSSKKSCKSMVFYQNHKGKVLFFYMYYFGGGWVRLKDLLLYFVFSSE